MRWQHFRVILQQGLHSNMPMTVLRLALAVCGILWLLNLLSQYRMFDLAHVLLC